MDSEADILHHSPDSRNICWCPSCLLSMYMSDVFSATQPRTCPTILDMYPPCGVQQPPIPVRAPSQLVSPRGGMWLEPPPQKVSFWQSYPLESDELEIVRSTVECPLFSVYGICWYCDVCMLPHVGHQGARQWPTQSQANLMEQAASIGQNHAKGHFNCDVCGFRDVPRECCQQVGDTAFYRYCPRCAAPSYQPLVVQLIESITMEVGDDSQFFKDEVDRIRNKLPEILKIPFTYEAYRIASMRFSRSLISKHDIEHVLQACSKLNPFFDKVISIGSGTGYVEHMFNELANYGEHSSKFCEDHKASCVSFFAFDSLPAHARYSVAVTCGGPSSILCFDCTNAVLLLCWPPFGSVDQEQSSMAFESLLYFAQCGGSLVVYIGDPACSGDWRFHQLLHREFEPVEGYEVRKEVRRWCPYRMGLVFGGADSVGLYAKRSSGQLTNSRSS